MSTNSNSIHIHSLVAKGMLLCSMYPLATEAFLPHAPNTHNVAGVGTNHPQPLMYTNTKKSKSILRTSIFDDFEEFESSSDNTLFSSSSSSNSNKDDDNIFASLRARQEFLNSGIKSEDIYSYNAQDEILQNWKNAECCSAVRLSLDDYIRRIAVDTYPLAVVGSSRGNIYLADLEKREELDCIDGVHEAHIDGHENVSEAMGKLYGLYDGGGVISLAINNDIVVSSGREGGVHVFKIDGEERELYTGSRGGTSKSTKLHLKSEGKIRYLDATLVTALAFDRDGLLWTAGYDGFIRAFEYDDADTPLAMQKEPVYELDVGSEVLSVTVNDDIGCGVATTVAGTVILFSSEDGEIMAEWKPFGMGKKRKNEYARCAMIVNNDEESPEDGQDAIWSIVCGGSKGSMYQRRLNIDAMGYVSDRKPFLNDEALRGRLRPAHKHSVMAMASPYSGLLISGSQDGTIRIWDCSYNKKNDDYESNVAKALEDDEEEAYCDDIGGEDKRPHCLYALTGYKVWLGSIFTNGKKIVSDGADNTIIVHDFSGEEDGTEGFLSDEDDMEDFSFD